MDRQQRHLRPGLLHGLAGPGRFDLLDTVGGQDREPPAAQLICPAKAPPPSVARATGVARSDRIETNPHAWSCPRVDVSASEQLPTSRTPDADEHSGRWMRSATGGTSPS
ncbi:hypothetical protein GCM10027271_02180 [Saccharopolyspora gloriosae]|uniref:Uncharacterized protein n=1 Tax=Saccharopolyspora gloriosae TaxID=455344 RepID=A0A840NFZ9_9PSEU|nr:hypothetical protein [Saccharopolyspora gloriosae]